MREQLAELTCNQGELPLTLTLTLTPINPETIPEPEPEPKPKPEPGCRYGVEARGGGMGWRQGADRGCWQGVAVAGAGKGCWQAVARGGGRGWRQGVLAGVGGLRLGLSSHATKSSISSAYSNLADLRNGRGIPPLRMQSRFHCSPRQVGGRSRSKT